MHAVIYIGVVWNMNRRLKKKRYSRKKEAQELRTNCIYISSTGNTLFKIVCIQREAGRIKNRMNLLILSPSEEIHLPDRC
jgi:hypothetical protein